MVLAMLRAQGGALGAWQNKSACVGVFGQRQGAIL
jgi:hypothetical protein